MQTSRTRSETFPAIDFRGTSSWQFYRLSQIETQLVGKRPLSIVRDGGLDHTGLIVRVHREKWRADQIAKIIDDNFLLLRVKQIKAAHQNPIDCRAGCLTLDCRSCWSRNRCRTWVDRRFGDALCIRPDWCTAGSRHPLGDPNIFLRQARVELV